MIAKRQPQQPLKRHKMDLNCYNNSTSYIAATRNLHQFVNYYPYRHEFDSEYREYAELLISDLTSADLQNKKMATMQNIKQYDGILQIRNKIKNFILDRKLMLFWDKKNNRSLRKGDKQQINEQQVRRSLMDKLQPICKYFKSTSEFVSFIETNALIKTQMMRINQYLEYRASGCRTMEDIQMRIRVNGFSNGGSGSGRNRNKRNGRKRARHHWQLEIVIVRISIAMSLRN